jgi:hypothetical protein
MTVPHAKYADLLQRCKRIGDFHPDTKFKSVGDIWQAIYRRDHGRVPAAELLVGYLSEFIDNLADCSSGPESDAEKWRDAVRLRIVTDTALAFARAAETKYSSATREIE